MLSYSRAILEAITETLDDMEISYVTDDDDGVCFVDLNNDDPLIRSLSMEISALSEGFVIQSNASATIDMNDFELVNAMMEFICRINYRLAYGAFIIDFDSGAVFYRNIVDCAELDCPTQEMVKRAFVAGVGVWKTVAQGMGAVLYGERSAQEGLDLCVF